MAISNTGRRNSRVSQKETFFTNTRVGIGRSQGPISVSEQLARVLALRQEKIERFEENRRSNILNEGSEYYDGKRKPSYLNRGGFL